MFCSLISIWKFWVMFCPLVFFLLSLYRCMTIKNLLQINIICFGHLKAEEGGDNKIAKYINNNCANNPTGHNDYNLCTILTNYTHKIHCCIKLSCNCYCTCMWFWLGWWLKCKILYDSVHYIVLSIIIQYIDNVSAKYRYGKWLMVNWGVMSVDDMEIWDQ